MAKRGNPFNGISKEEKIRRIKKILASPKVNSGLKEYWRKQLALLE